MGTSVRDRFIISSLTIRLRPMRVDLSPKGCGELGTGQILGRPKAVTGKSSRRIMTNARVRNWRRNPVKPIERVVAKALTLNLLANAANPRAGEFSSLPRSHRIQISLRNTE